MSIPLFACRRGTATASVPSAAGATYEWTAEGATIIEGAGTPLVRNVRWSPSTIKAGGTATLSFDSSGYLQKTFRTTLPDARSAELGAWTCSNTYCSATFTDKKGAGSIPATITWAAECAAGDQSLSSTLTITP